MEAGMPRSTLSRVNALVLIGLLLGLHPAAGQVTYAGALSAGHAFMLDLDDPDPSGSYSVAATLERRQPGSAFSFGVEAGLHRYLILRQDLAPDVTGWASKIEDIRRAWRVTPFLRLGTQGSPVRVYGQLGTGLYLRQASYSQQEREQDVLVVDTRYRSADAAAGVHLGLGLELLPGTGPLGFTAGLRAHSLTTGGNGFYTAEAGIVYRWGNGRRHRLSAMPSAASESRREQARPKRRMVP
jgi:hypothetical protein